MTRTLQVYMSHPRVQHALTLSATGGDGSKERAGGSGGGGGGDDENEDDDDDDADDADKNAVKSRLMRDFYAKLFLLRSFPLSLVTNVHRELYIKKLIKRRITKDWVGTNYNMNLSDAYLLNRGFELNHK